MTRVVLGAAVAIAAWSSAAARRGHASPGDVGLRAARRAFRQAHERWAATLEELPIAPPADVALRAATLKTTESLYEASVELRLPGRPPQRWHIRQDALVWSD